MSEQELQTYSNIESSTQSLQEIIEKHAPMVKRIAHHLYARLPNTVQIDDLIQSGMIGLLEAAKNFNKDKGASFETYAGIRIRGMMLDEVRKGDWVPRSVHKNSRLISQAIRKVENELGRDARDSEVAEALGIAINDYHQMLVDCSGAKLFALDEMSASQENLTTELFQSNTPKDLFDKVHNENLKKHLTDAIVGLPEREQLVLALYYDEELNLKEIGDVLGVSESRISQIHSQAMLRLQSRIQDWLE